MSLRQQDAEYRARARDNGKADAEREVVARAAREITPAPVKFVWEDRWPLGALTLVAGEGGLGKSMLLAEQHARLSCGELTGELSGRPAHSLLITTEDHAASVVVPRLIAAGADLDLVHLVTVKVGDAEGGLVTFPDDLPGLEQRIEEHGARMLSIDPVVAALSGAIDTHKDHSIRRVLAPLAQLAERRELAVVGVIHMNKTAVSDLLNRVSGSKGFVNAARSLLVFARDPDDPLGDEGYDRVVVHAKSNWARLAPTMAASIETRHLHADETGAEETIATSRLVITGESDVTRADISAREDPAGSDKKDLARHWLVERLGVGAWHDSGEIKTEAEQAGHSVRTLIRAFMELVGEGAGRVKTEGFPRRSYWQIHSGAKGSGTTNDRETGTTGATRMLEPKTGGRGSQWCQPSMVGTTEAQEVPRAEFCDCRSPARSPRADGWFCMTCRRPGEGPA